MIVSFDDYIGSAVFIKADLRDDLILKFRYIFADIFSVLRFKYGV